MKLLLDTQVAIWALTSPGRLSVRARELVDDEGNEIVVSAASVWEIAIKFALGKRKGAPPFSGVDALKYFRAAGYRLLSITPEHTAAVDALPPLHSDPFDRLLLAQSLHEPMRLMTADAILASYSENIIRV